MKKIIKDTFVLISILAIFIGILMIHRPESKHACEMPNTTYTLLVQYADTADTVTMQQPKGNIHITHTEKNGEPDVIISVTDTTDKITLWSQDYIGAKNISVIK